MKPIIVKIVFFSLFLGFLPVSALATTELEDDLQKRALLYFVEQSHPVTGLILDRAYNFDSDVIRHYEMASLAATGFGIAIFANAATRGWMEAEEARLRIERVLKFVNKNLDHYHGWLYHFVHWETGVRYGNSEISTIDTSWFLAGALYAAAMFPDSEISREVALFYKRLDFIDMLTDGGRFPEKSTISQGWMPEYGYIPAQWDRYAEQLFLLILGLGSPTSPLPDRAWAEGNRPFVEWKDSDLIIGGHLPLFVHQYSHLFLDHSALGAPVYFENSRRASLLNRDFCANQTKYATFREGFWGLSAGDSKWGYLAYSPVFYDGTVCPACAGASAMFLPQLVMQDLARWHDGSYAPLLYGRYGFIDSFNLDQKWFDHDVIGITVGALYLSLADIHPQTTLWSVMAKIPEIREGMRRAKAIGSPFQY